MQDILNELNNMATMDDDEVPVSISDLWQTIGGQERTQTLPTAAEWHDKLLASVQCGRMMGTRGARNLTAEEEFAAAPSVEEFAADCGFDLNGKLNTCCVQCKLIYVSIRY